jgi:Family of unknown function (DUF5989)
MKQSESGTGNWLVKPASFMIARWRIWLPPVLLTIITFVVVVLLTKGKTMLPFLYRFS